MKEPNPAAFFDELLQSFLLAEGKGNGSGRYFYTLDSHSVEVRFAGSSLVPFVVPALEHLRSSQADTPSLTVCVYDSRSTGAEVPPAPWSISDYTTRGEIRGYNDGRFCTACDPGTGALSMVDTERHLALYWVRDAAQLPYWERAAPLRTIIHWWMQGRGYQLAHAAAVGTREGGVLVAGRGGSGKSTVALACLHAGLLYAGDDYVLLKMGPFPYVYSLYNTAKLDAGHMERLPYLLASVARMGKAGAEKTLLFVGDRYKERISRGFPVKAILLPRVTGLRETRLRRTSPVDCLKALAPSTIFQLPGSGNRTLQNLALVVKGLPGYILEVGTDVSGIPHVVAELVGGEVHSV